MPSISIGGIATRYEVEGDGPPLLMFSPGGFDATVEKWTGLGIYARTRPLEVLTRHYRCIMFDRRECGESGGRVERVTWAHYVAQGVGLLDHLGVEKAHLMGGCMGCAPVAAFGTAHPERALSMVLYWPVGGAKYRINGQQRFTDHLAYVSAHGMAAVVALVRESGKAFGADPRGGPWASTIKADEDFAASYAGLDLDKYKLTVLGMCRALMDRDTAPGTEPEELMQCGLPALIIPGSDNAHAMSAARYLQECLPNAAYWDVAVADQASGNTGARLLEFLGGV